MSQGKPLHPPTITGETAGYELLKNYRVLDGPTLEMPVDPYDPTPEELQAIRELLDSYYHVGETVTISAQAIEGYLPPEFATRTFVLGESTTTHTFVYSTIDEIETSELVDAGTTTVATSAIAATTIGAAVWVLRKQTSRYYRLYRHNHC